MTAKHALRFYHSATLRHRSDRILAAIETDEDPTTHTDALAELVVDLTEAGMEYYFLRPIRQAKLGLVARKTADYGVSGAIRLMAPMVRRILHHTSAEQLRTIAAHMRHLQEEG